MEDILYEAAGGVATVTINRPDRRNAVRFRSYEELTAAMRTAAADPTVGVVVLQGAGHYAFCAGGDVQEQARTRTPAIGRQHMQRLFALSVAMRSMDKPLIAKIRGWCVGSGSELNLFCDLAIASEGARFGQPALKAGSVPVWGETQLLARLVGERKAREMILTARIYSAAEALAMGLVNEVCTDDELDARVQAACDRILDLSPQAIRIARLSLNAASDREFYGNFFPHAELLASAYGSPENLEGIQGFLERRPPAFRAFRR
jgi:enoyl-CoA hydratase/carnithine racemase